MANQTYAALKALGFNESVAESLCILASGQNPDGTTYSGLTVSPSTSQYPPLLTIQTQATAISVTDSTSGVTLLAANLSRKGLILFNQGPNVVYVCTPGAAPSSSFYEFFIVPATTAGNQNCVFNGTPTGVPTQAFSGFVSGAGNTSLVFVTEYV